MTTDPVSMACEAIQTSLIGKGVPAFLRLDFTSPKISAVSEVAFKILTVGFSKKRCRKALFSRSLEPPAKPA